VGKIHLKSPAVRIFGHALIYSWLNPFDFHILFSLCFFCMFFGLSGLVSGCDTTGRPCERFGLIQKASERMSSPILLHALTTARISLIAAGAVLQ
jgi:hypothetical protein